MQRAIAPKTARSLAARAPLRVAPDRAIAIKRDVHEFVVECAADVFMAAMHEVLVDAEGTFGLIRVKRPAERLGEPFSVGERFQGCFSLELAARAWVGGRGPLAATLVERLLATAPATRVVTWLEDQLLSNYAEIERLELEPSEELGGAYLLRYRYLEGTPIAGTNTYVIDPLGPKRCRVRQIFEYQEVNAVAMTTFQRFGLKFHDQVIASQVAQAAARCGGATFRGTVPDAYARLVVGDAVDGASGRSGTTSAAVAERVSKSGTTPAAETRP